MRIDTPIIPPAIPSTNSGLILIPFVSSSKNRSNPALEAGSGAFFICKKCGLPDDLCACGELEKEDTRIIVRLEKRRFSKTTTMIEGIDPKQSDVQSIIKELKSRFACGGTAKDGFIMLQGDHRDDVKSYLLKMGFNEAAIEVQ
jgi:translation initiation factor 1